MMRTIHWIHLISGLISKRVICVRVFACDYDPQKCLKHINIKSHNFNFDHTMSLFGQKRGNVQNSVKTTSY